MLRFYWAQPADEVDVASGPSGAVIRKTWIMADGSRLTAQANVTRSTARALEVHDV